MHSFALYRHRLGLTSQNKLTEIAIGDIIDRLDASKKIKIKEVKLPFLWIETLRQPRDYYESTEHSYYSESNSCKRLYKARGL